MPFRAASRLKSVLSFLPVVAFACGSPGELGEGFPPYDQTGYAGAPTGTAGVGGPAPQAGTGGSAGQGGTGNIAGTGNVAGTGGNANPGGAAGTGGSGNPGGAGGGAPTVGCPDDIVQLFNRPAAQGGCGDGGCHTPGGFPPDLTSPDPASRLLDTPASAACSGRPYVGAADSVLAEKITSPDPTCGEPMPFFAENNLTAEDEACILDWIDEVSGN
jgi:hypothetical protein